MTKNKTIQIGSLVWVKPTTEQYIPQKNDKGEISLYIPELTLGIVSIITSDHLHVNLYMQGDGKYVWRDIEDVRVIE